MYRDGQCEKDVANDGKPKGSPQQTPSPEAVQTFRDKRPLDKDCVYDGNPEGKRQQRPIASRMLEGVMRNALQAFSSTMEPMIRRIVSEEVERAVTKLVRVKPEARISSFQIQSSDSRNLRLQFKGSVPPTLFTGSRVEGEEGSALHVILQDALTGQVVTTGGPESSVKLDVAVLEGDFPHDDEEDWNQDDFKCYEVREREGKRPLLIGELTLTLRKGVGTLGAVSFTDNSSWVKSRKFRIAVKVAAGFCEGLRIREAMTQAFMVKDRRGELYKKHFPPELCDDVWRLQNIGKDGTFHKKLSEAGISTVQEFLKQYVKDEERLKTILGSMPMKMWESTVNHAKTCLLGGKLYVFYIDDTHSVGIIFNRICQLIGITINGDFTEPEKLAESEKLCVDKLVKVAYEKWDTVVEYDNEALADGLQYRSTGSRNCIGDQITNQESGRGATIQKSVAEQDSSLDLSAPPVQHIPFAAAVGQSKTVLRPAEEVLTNIYEPKMAYIDQEHQAIDKSPVGLPRDMSMGYDPFIHVSSTSQKNLISHDVETIVPPPFQFDASSSLGRQFDFKFVAESSHVTDGRTPDNTGRIYNNPMLEPTSVFHRDNNVTEEEIRMGSSEMLQGEEMQELLQVMLGESSPDAFSDDYVHYGIGSTYAGFPENESHTLFRASVGWLKVKAALRWAIFIRKLVAKKRAIVIELED